MKKHNEGYSLVLVLVVLVLMSLVASFILSVSLKNLQSQTAAVSRMEDKYTAAGEIEKIVAQLEAGAEVFPIETVDSGTGITVKLSSLGPNQLEIKSFSGDAGVRCVLELNENSITVDADVQTISITKQDEVKYLSYEYLAREVTQDE